MDFENQIKGCIVIIITLERAASLMIYNITAYNIIVVMKAETVVLFNSIVTCDYHSGHINIIHSK